ncbi:heparan-alpha-glucosaminide N-acetyltransferase-like [Lingula anatina]|uniref:Heparan-alpha-glucosaminide N-acetyltransferase-like n=1 Tax=Lingula anatina TaxID=7574 RepID=A0A1S3HTB5_LINAN|nr:heparan-alpha-glucosaminide N-acetyltransferase-like [Lingula anatina]|eukprot:XP_013389277.2 heparan-alpha-glucosaminide N-acetyltransferase-like [Lingula anatina]
MEDYNFGFLSVVQIRKRKCVRPFIRKTILRKREVSDLIEGKSAAQKTRLISLDTFRGISITLMIFVNFGAGKYWFLEHAIWHGLNFADLVFPWFVFIMGTAMALTFHSLKKKEVSYVKQLKKIVTRSITLFFLGIVGNTWWAVTRVENIRIPGVLQRFAATYLVVGLVDMVFSRKLDHKSENKEKQTGKDENGSSHELNEIETSSSSNVKVELGSNIMLDPSVEEGRAKRQPCWYHITELVLYWPEWLICLAFIALHLGITLGVKVPDSDCPIGYQGPGGLADGGKYYNCTGGIAGYIDRWILGAERIYNWPTCKEMYKTILPFDPEGILGTATSVVICFLGLHAGKVLLVYKSHMERVAHWIVGALITGGLALLLCKGSKNEGWVPINKNLWSVSYVLALAAMAYLLLAACYILIDMFHIWTGAPFFYPGMNAIVLYVGHSAFSRSFPIRFEIPENHGARLALDLWSAAFWVLVAFYMHRRGVFIKI